jgi:type II secretory ATPase GspE/PulE/Tfp pilus assembly ATPase PilB-like protein
MQSRLCDILCRRGVLDAAEAVRVRDGLDDPGGLAARLVALDLVDEDVLVNVLAEECTLPRVDPRLAAVPRDAVAAVPHGLARRHQLVPVALDGALLTIAMADPTDQGAVAHVTFLTGLDVQAAVAPPSAVRDAIARLYGEAPELADALSGLGPASPEERAPVQRPSDADDAPVVRYVHALLAEAVRRGASDVHVEPFDGALRVRLRVDGVLAEVAPPPAGLAAAITTRVKVMARLDIAERRLPQDGRLEFAAPGSAAVDVRVSVLPTLHGETIVLRLLDRTGLARRLETLGLDAGDLERLRAALAQPQGLVLATGPTGSGKTTTLYAALTALDAATVNVCTVEDPVEIQLHGVNQVTVRDDIGLSFAAALRAFLRQDPDVIMVGEIRDLETADIAVKAALTGHLVLSTLHTNDAPSAVTRLLDMGIAPFLLTGSLLLVVAQRLVRVLCPACAEDVPVDPTALCAAGFTGPSFDGRRRRGCRDCGGTGFRGRTSVYQLMPANPAVREAIVAGASVLQLTGLARAAGMRSLREAGLALAARGVTTLDEVLRVTPADAAD